MDRRGTGIFPDWRWPEITTFLALDAVSGGNGALAGFSEILTHAPERFRMIIEKGTLLVSDGTSGTMKDAFLDLPGTAVRLGSMWLTNICFWGFNQYIIQRGLAAKSVREAQYGLAFAGFLKLLVPLLVVIPGIAAYVLKAGIGKSDEAYPWLLNNIVPPGITGFAFAALVAAVVSSLSSTITVPGMWKHRKKSIPCSGLPTLHCLYFIAIAVIPYDSFVTYVKSPMGIPIP